VITVVHHLVGIESVRLVKILRIVVRIVGLHAGIIYAALVVEKVAALVPLIVVCVHNLLLHLRDL